MGIISTSKSAAGAVGDAATSGLDQTTIIIIIVIIVVLFIIALIVWAKTKQGRDESHMEASGGDDRYSTPRLNPRLLRDTSYSPMIDRDPLYNPMVAPGSSFNPMVARDSSYNPMVARDTSYTTHTTRAGNRTNTRGGSYDARNHRPRDTANLLGKEDTAHEGLRIPSPVTPAGSSHDWSRVSQERRGSRGSDELQIRGPKVISFVDGTGYR